MEETSACLIVRSFYELPHSSNRMSHSIAKGIRELIFRFLKDTMLKFIPITMLKFKLFRLGTKNSCVLNKNKMLFGIFKGKSLRDYY